ncbi:MAG: hypothetical protein A4E49_02722 [Methanosaeta sp. PtaU1.Bin112]|nr:MAG: hypothetical protein A4E49_02722 [Methanosaeta sp. PtaU1.Bin112]
MVPAYRGRGEVDPQWPLGLSALESIAIAVAVAFLTYARRKKALDSQKEDE